MSYQAQASIIINKFIFEQMVYHTRDLHNRIFGMELENTIKCVLRDLYITHKNSQHGSYEKKHCTDIINDMCAYVNGKCNATKTTIYETWLKVVYGVGVDTAYDNEIIECLREFFFGDVQTYQIIFEHNDRKTRKGRYYYVIKLQFDKNDKVKMLVSIQDLTSYYSSLEKGLSIITGSSISNDGFIEFDVSSNTLFELGKYTYREFNNCGFTGGFELYPQVSLLNNDKIQEYVSDYIAQSQFNKKFIDLLVAF